MEPTSQIGISYDPHRTMLSAAIPSQSSGLSASYFAPAPSSAGVDFENSSFGFTGVPQAFRFQTRDPNVDPAENAAAAN